MASYSVQIDGLPSNVTKEEVNQYFAELGYDVHEVSLARNYHGILRYYKEKARLREKVAKRKGYLRNQQLCLHTDKSLLKIKEKIAEIDTKIDNEIIAKRHNELPVVKAFVIFNEINDRVRCLRLHRTYKFLFLNLRRPTMIGGQHKLTITPAPEPSTIL